MLISSMNGLYNPDFLVPDARGGTDRFERTIAILSALTQTQRLHWIEHAGANGRFSIVISDHANGFEKAVDDLHELLDLPPPQDAARGPLVLPVSLAMDGQDAAGIGVVTRSVMRLTQILAASIEVPNEDLAAGVAMPMLPAGPIGQGLKVHYTRTSPRRAAMAVAYREGWFFIDDADAQTKAYFHMLATLWSAAIAESTTGRLAAPVLTVPVSR